MNRYGFGDEQRMFGGNIPGLFAASPNIGNLPPEMAANLITSSLQAISPQGSGTPFEDFEEYYPAAGANLAGTNTVGERVSGSPLGQLLQSDIAQNILGAVGLDDPTQSIFGMPWKNDPALGVKGSIQQGRPTGSDILAERLGNTKVQGHLLRKQITSAPGIPDESSVINEANRQRALDRLLEVDPGFAPGGFRETPMGPTPVPQPIVSTPGIMDESAVNEVVRGLAAGTDPAFGIGGIRNTGVQPPTSMFDRFTPAPFEQGINIGGAGFTEPPIDARTAAFLSGVDPAFGPEGERTAFVNRPLVEADRLAALAAAANLSPESLVPSNILGFEEPAAIPTRAEQEAAAMASGVDIGSPWFTKYDTPESIKAIEAGVPYQYQDDVAKMYGQKMLEGDPSWGSPMMGSGNREGYFDDALAAIYNMDVGLPGGPTVSASDIVGGITGAAQGAADLATAGYQSASGTTDADITNRFNSAIEFYNSVKGTPQEAYAKSALDRATAEHNARFTDGPVEVDMGDTSAPGGAVASAVPAKEPAKAVQEANKVVKQLADTAATTTTSTIGGDPFAPWDESVTQTESANVPVVTPVAKAPAAKAPAANVPFTPEQWVAAGYTLQPDGSWDIEDTSAAPAALGGGGGGGVPMTTGSVTNPWQQSLYDASLTPSDAFRKWRTEQFGGAPLSVLGSERGQAALTGGYYPAYGRFLLNRAAGGGQGMDMVGPGQAFGQYLRGQRAPLEDIRSRYSRLSDYLTSDETMLDPQYQNYGAMFGVGPSRSDMVAMSQAALGIGGGMSGRVGQNLGTLYDLMQDRYGAGGTKKFADYVGGSFYQPQTMVPGAITAQQAFAVPSNPAANAFTTAAAGNGMNNNFEDWKKPYGGG